SGDLPLLRTRPATLRGHVRGYGLITAGLRRVPPDLPRDHRRTSAQVTSDSPPAPPCLRRGGNLGPLTTRRPRPRHQHPHPSIPPLTGSVATTLRHRPGGLRELPRRAPGGLSERVSPGSARAGPARTAPARRRLDIGPSGA